MEIAQDKQTPEQERQSAEAAFAASDPAPVTAAEVVVDKVVEEAKPVVEAQPDPWEGVPAVVRETLEGITTKLGGITDLQNEVKAGTGRIAAIQRELALKAKEGGDPAPTKQAIVAAFESPEKLKKLTEEWPDVGEAVADALSREREAMQAAILKQVPQVDVEGITRQVGETVTASVNERVSQSTGASAERVRALIRMDIKYPTWEEDIYDSPKTRVLKPEVAEWTKTQPPEVQALADSNDHRDALKWLDLYYEHKKAADKLADNNERLAAAIPARGTRAQRQPTQNDRDAAEKAFASA